MRATRKTPPVPADHRRRTNLAERVRRLAAIREREGYMARAEKDGHDWLLIEDHRPICSGARRCVYRISPRKPLRTPVSLVD